MKLKNPITDSLSELYRSDPLKACRKALRMTRDVHDRDRIEVINALLGLHGTEALRGEWQNGYWCDIVAVYANAGDTYALTVIQVRGETSLDRSRFIVSSWGDWVERNGERYGIM